MVVPILFGSIIAVRGNGRKEAHGSEELGVVLLVDECPKVDSAQRRTPPVPQEGNEG
jgi:hypothetical protein